jgi:formate dehydrogenase iron-sulfur subunit
LPEPHEPFAQNQNRLMTPIADIAAHRASPPEPQTLIDELLAEQRSLSAVERFSRAQGRCEIPAKEKHYRSLLPAAAPQPGQQYAFEVDLDKCSGCKACVTACHSLNGLDETETWRTVGLLVSAGDDIRSLASKPVVSQRFLTSSPTLFQQHVTTACHHCADPGCANGCPVLAYDKDPVTGIVRHLDDQCIGCSYCVMKCPYEVPKYSDRLGIVRKCDMCSQRLAVGEAPACVQACPDEAIKITLIETAAIGYRQSAINNFLPDSPDSRITLPTTRFLSTKLPSDLVAADHAAPRLDHAHWPLVIMLVLTQAAAGMFLATTIASATGSRLPVLPMVGFITLSLGLTVSVLHLGQPLKAWRAFLGWRKSWLSREIIAFNLFAGTALTAVAVPWIPPIVKWQSPISGFATAFGLAAVFVSVMVYVDTKRPLWCARITFGNFFGTTLLLGATCAAVVFGWMGHFALAQPFAVAALVIRTALFVWRRFEIHAALRNPASPIHLNTRTIRELLPWTVLSRTQLFLASTIFGLLAIANVAQLAPVWASIAALTTFSSELIGRYVFFAAGAAKRMPGGFAA